MSDATKKQAPWTDDELAALNEGVAKYGTGKWKKIVDDETLGPRLTARDNKHVMDKWRHLHPKSESDTAQVEEGKESAYTPHHPDALVEPAAKKSKIDDLRTVISDHHLETMVVACVGVLKDKNGSNQKKMLQWLVQKLQDQGDTERLPPNKTKHLHGVLEHLVTEQTLVKNNTLYKLPEPIEGGLPETIAHFSKDDPRKVVTDEHLETMVVACVGVLKDKGGSNQTRMLKWLSQKLVDQGDTERLPPNEKKHLHAVLEKLVTEQTLVKHNTLYTLPEPVEGGLELASPSKKSPKKHARGVEPDEHTVPHAGAEEAQTPLCMYHAGEKVKDRLSLEKAQVHELPRTKGKAQAEHLLDDAMDAIDNVVQKEELADRAEEAAEKAEVKADKAVAAADKAAAALLHTATT